MCWSENVSITFALFEFVAILFLCFRNDQFDRFGAVLGLPLLMQEVLQAFLWRHIGLDPHTCDDTNRLLSFLVVLVVCSIAFTVSLVSRRSWTLIPNSSPATPTTTPESPRSLALTDSEADIPLPAPRAIGSRVRRLWWVVFVLQILIYCGVAYFFLQGLKGVAGETYPPLCTFPGPKGHQNWPICYAWPQSAQYPFFLFYSLFISAGLYFYQGPLYVPVIQMLSASGMSFLYMIYGTESGSIWCWSASTQLLMFMLLPYLRPRIEARYGVISMMDLSKVVGED